MLILDDLIVSQDRLKTKSKNFIIDQDVVGEELIKLTPTIYKFPNDRYLISDKYRSFFFKVFNICNTILDILTKQESSNRLRTKTNGFTREEIIHLLILGKKEKDLDGKSGYINYNYRFIPVSSANNMNNLINIIHANSSFYTPDKTIDKHLNPDKIFSVFINKDFDLISDRIFLQAVADICDSVFETELINTLQIPAEYINGRRYIVLSTDDSYYPTATFILEYYLSLYLLIIRLFDSMNVQFENFSDLDAEIDTSYILPGLNAKMYFADEFYKFAYGIYHFNSMNSDEEDFQFKLKYIQMDRIRNRGLNLDISDFCQTDRFYNLIKDIIEENFDNSIW